MPNLFLNNFKPKLFLLILSGIFLFSSSAFASQSPWPLFSNNPQHTGQSEYSGPETNEIKWVSNLLKIYSGSNISPVISSDGTIYFTRSKGIIYAVNPDGTLKWEKNLYQNINSQSPAIGSDGIIYLATDKGKLIALNQEDGSVKWVYSTPFQKWIRSAPTISLVNGEEIIYFTSYDNYIYALNSDGTLKWEYQTDNMIESSPAVDKNEIIYFGSVDGFLYALNPNGTLKWKFNLGNSTASSPAIDENGIIYISTGTGTGKAKFYAIDPDGSEKWEYEHHHRIGSPSIDEFNQTVYIPVDGKSNQSKLIALNKENGEPKWEFETNSDAGWFFSKLAIDKDGTIYGGREYLYAVNPNGELKWKYNKWTENSLSPAIGKDGTLYIPYRESGSGWTGTPIYQLYAFGLNSPYPPPEKYAPNLWFDSDESYYPIDPFFYTEDIDEISGEASKYNYLNNLSEEDRKKNKFTVFYHIVETEDKTQWVYEYFFYYAYNKMPYLNEHYHDWEGVFVFVDKETEEVERVVASAHGKWANNNEYFNPNFNSGERAGIMIEGGSHANCIDRNNDGLFQWETDITNGPWPFAWGIFNRNINDKKHGYQIQPETYNSNLIEITGDFIDKFGRDENGKRLKTFLHSPILGIKCFNVPIFGGYKCISGVGGKPAEHPWIDDAYDNPEEIIPKFNNYINGTINPLFIPGLTHPAMGIILIMSEEPYPFTFTNENGDFLINNIEPGEHNIIVNLENYAPYKQRFIIEENETIVGVNGILNLIPESESFRFEGTAKDEKGNLIINVPVDVYDENNQKLFTTLTDENGQYLFNLSSKNNHTIEIINEDNIGKIENVSGNSGETIIEEIIVSNPKSLKENTLSELKEIETDNQKVKNQINKIEKLIEESLDESLWIDNWHLKEKKFLGLKVFRKEYSAVKRIERISKYSKSKWKKNKGKDLESILPILNKSADDLSQADYLLAETILNETKKEIENLDKDKLNKKQKKLLKISKKLIKKAEQYLKKAEKQRLKKNYSKSIYYSMKSWTLSKQTKYLINLIKKGE